MSLSDENRHQFIAQNWAVTANIKNYRTFKNNINDYNFVILLKRSYSSMTGLTNQMIMFLYFTERHYTYTWLSINDNIYV